MGYCIEQLEAKFSIPASRVEEAFQRLRAGIVAVFAKNQRMSWIRSDEAAKALTFMDLMEECRWEVEIQNGTGEVCGIQFIGEKLGDDLKLLNFIAPCVSPGSFINMAGEDGSQWQWYFDGQNCHERRAVVTYEEPPVYDVVDVAAREVVESPQLPGPRSE